MNGGGYWRRRMRRAPNIPPKANRQWKNCFSPFLYRNRNAIERMFGRLKDFRRVATRYDRNAANFLAAVSISATARACQRRQSRDPCITSGAYPANPGSIARNSCGRFHALDIRATPR